MTTQQATAAGSSVSAVLTKTPITVAHGDGIGPEIMQATLHILQEAGAALEIETIEIGEKVYERGVTAGIDPSSWESLRRTQVFLKAPITTPQGGGFKSLNVTTRKTLGLYANIRPCVAYAPYVKTKHPKMDLVIVRENEEDLYAGIEHRQTEQVMQCLKLITRPGCEKIVRYAFEYAVMNHRKKVTAFSKDNIMKMTDGLFHQVFDEVAKEYPQIENEHWIVDIGAAKMADTPDAFDVIVMPNLYGDILSDVAAQIAGSVGLAGSANIGDPYAMFEAIHGSAPRRAGQDMANPSGLLHGAIQMMVHINQPEVAERVHNAWLKTLEDGIHTYDIFTEGVSKEKVGTQAFAKAVVARLGQEPETLKVVRYKKGEEQQKGISLPSAQNYVRTQTKATVGVDVFLDCIGKTPDEIGEVLKTLAGPDFELRMVSNRGVKVYPNGFPETYCTDHWRCRFVAPGGPQTAPDQSKIHAQIVQLLERVRVNGFDFIKTENLCTFDGKLGYTLGQGE